MSIVKWRRRDEAAPDASDEAAPAAERYRVPQLPVEIWTWILGYVPREYLTIVAATSRSFRAIARGIGIPRIPLSLVAQSVSLLEWARANGCAWDARTCAAAAAGGHLAVLQWLRGYNPDGMPSDRERCAWDARTCAAAAAGSHLAVLEWARANGCPWNETACAAAAGKGHLEVLQWLRAKGCRWDDTTTTAAAKGGHLRVLQWASDNGCPVDRGNTRPVAGAGHLDVLEWLYAKKDGIMDTHTAARAAEYGHLDVLKWLWAHRCYPDHTACSAAAMNGHLDVLKWLQLHTRWTGLSLTLAIRNGHLDVVMFVCGYNDDGVTPWTEYVGDVIRWTTEYSATAAKYNRLDILKWARTHGFPWDEETCAQAARKGHIELLEWAHTHGCPWNDETMTSAVEASNLEVIMYLRGYNRDGTTRWTDNDADCLPWSDRTCYIAARKGNVNVLEWAVHHGCPWDPDYCSSAANTANIQNWIHNHANVGTLIYQFSGRPRPPTAT